MTNAGSSPGTAVCHRVTYKWLAVVDQGMPSLVDQTRDLVELFVDVATTDPAAAPLLVAGGVLFGVSLGVVGLLAGGAVLEAAGRRLE